MSQLNGSEAEDVQFALDYFTERDRYFESALRRFRQHARDDRISANPWLRMQEVLGSASNWPQIIRRKIWCSNLRYADRAFLASFGFANGCPSDLLVDVLKFCNTHATEVKCQKIIALYGYFGQDSEEGDRIREKYYAFNLIIGRVLDLNRNIRTVFPAPSGVNIGRSRQSRSDLNYHC